MLDKKDAQWWILEAEKHPESAVDLIRMLADRLAFLDKQNEELRADVITLRRQLRGSTANAETESLKRRIAELERALQSGASGRYALAYRADQIEISAPTTEASASRELRTDTSLSLLICPPAAELLILTADSRVFSVGLNDLPVPEPGAPALLGNPRNVAAILDRAAFENRRFLTLLTGKGYVYSVLAGTLTQVAGRQEKLLRSLIPGDPVINAIPSYNGDLFAISRKGRWTRFPERAIAGSGSLVMELPTGDSLAGIVSLGSESELIFVTDEGRLFVRPSTGLATRKAPGNSAGMLFRGQNLRGVAVGREVYALTRCGKLLTADMGKLSTAAQSDAGIPLPGMTAGDSVLAFTAL